MQRCGAKISHTPAKLARAAACGANHLAQLLAREGRRDDALALYIRAIEATTPPDVSSFIFAFVYIFIYSFIH